VHTGQHGLSFRGGIKPTAMAVSTDAAALKKYKNKKKKKQRKQRE